MDYIHTQELTEKKPSGPKSFWTEVTEVKCLVDGLFSAFFYILPSYLQTVWICERQK